VNGIPRQSGSKTAFTNKKTGKAILVDASTKYKEWRTDVRGAFQEAFPNFKPLHGPIRLEVVFFMPRPKGHYGTGRNAGQLKGNAPEWHTTTPDRTKLLRNTEDALKKFAWNDDSQVVTGNTEKVYADGPPGAMITITSLNGDE
jgi:Holliday junction resolvase RusA-like endonuclease